jgi:hypothetical protein
MHVAQASFQAKLDLAYRIARGRKTQTASIRSACCASGF